MIGATRKLRVYAFAAPVDMRKSYNGLAGIVQQGLGRELLDGDVFLFVSKNLRRAKALFWDGTGVCIYQKRMEKGRFAKLWQGPPAGGELALTMSELALFFEGSEHVGKKALSPTLFDLDNDGQLMMKRSP